RRSAMSLSTRKSCVARTERSQTSTRAATSSPDRSAGISMRMEDSFRTDGRVARHGGAVDAARAILPGAVPLEHDLLHEPARVLVEEERARASHEHVVAHALASHFERGARAHAEHGAHGKAPPVVPHDGAR